MELLFVTPEPATGVTEMFATLCPALSSTRNFGSTPPPRAGAFGELAFGGLADCVNSTWCRTTWPLPKPQLASNVQLELKAMPQSQSFAFGNWNNTAPATTSHTVTCKSSPPAAKKPESGDQARHLMPAAHCKVEATWKAWSTNSKATMQFSPATASNFPEGANTVACKILSKTILPKYLHALLSLATRHKTVHAPACCVLCVIRPCISSVPPPPARNPPSGEKAIQFTWPSCRRSAISSKSGSDSSMTFLAVVPTARRSQGREARATVRTSPTTVVVPTSSRLAVLQTVTEQSASPAAKKAPLGAKATAKMAAPMLHSKALQRRSTSHNTTQPSSPPATKSPGSGPKATLRTSSWCSKRLASWPQFGMSLHVPAGRELPGSSSTAAERNSTCGEVGDAFRTSLLKPSSSLPRSTTTAETCGGGSKSLVLFVMFGRVPS
mmetsp:Transcript_20612/g.52018  ORF Transcript_20612/g.52018 Transcript_20612/m.52018 type:complete len:439 (-) Transcript_20612:554-1870(-)